MSLTLVSSPIKTVNGILSNVNASITQEPFEFLRADVTFTSTFNNAGFTRYDGVSPDPNTVFTIGDSIIVVGAAGGVVYGTVTDIPTADRIQTDIIHPNATTGDSGHINNLSGRADYSIQLVFYRSDKTTILIDDTFIYKPSQAGKLFVDLGSILVNLMENLDIAFQRYTLQYKEVYTGSSDPGAFTEEMLATLGEKAIGEDGGSNLWEKLLRDIPISTIANVLDDNGFSQIQIFALDVTFNFRKGDLVACLFDNNTLTDGTYEVIKGGTLIGGDTYFTISLHYQGQGSTGTVQAQDPSAFLTRFKNPKQWNGFSGQTVSIIFDSNFDTRVQAVNPAFRQRPTDINKNALDSNQNDFPARTPPRIEELALDRVKTNDSWVFNRVQVTLGGSATAISNILYYKYTDPCPNPIMIEWVNSLGASEFYMFDIAQQVTLAATEGLIYEVPFDEDVATITRPRRRLSSDEILQVTCIADNLSKDDIRALHEIKTSEKVEAWLTNDGLDKIGVTVEVGLTTEYATDEDKNRFTLTLLFPGDYDFFKLKQY